MSDSIQSDTQSTSVSLLQRVVNRDAAAWRQFCDLYGPLVYSWSRRCGLSQVDVADVMQEVFRAVALGVGAFQSATVGATFRGWLWTITRNKVRDFHRQRSTQVAAVGGSDAQRQLQQIPEHLPPTATSSGEGDNSTRRAIEAVRAEFEPRTWQAFWRTTVDHRPPADVAAELSMSLPAVYQAKSRVLRRLRQYFAGLFDD